MINEESKNADTEMIIQVNDYLVSWIEGFLIDRKASDMPPPFVPVRQLVLLVQTV